MPETQISSETVKELLKNPLLITRELNNRSLYHFLEYFWPVYSSQPFSTNWHLKYLCDELEKVADKVSKRQPRDYDLVINVPPGTTKTALVSIMFPIWCWTRWHWMLIITMSYSDKLSLESADYCRDILQSHLFKEMYPDIIIKEDKNVKSNFKIAKRMAGAGGIHRQDRLLTGGGRISTSLTGTITGFHADILIVDDPLNPTQAASEVELANANHFMEQTLPLRKRDKDITPTILIMQRLHMCLLPDTRVLTETRFVEIKDIHENDLILTSEGWGRVLGTYSRKYKGEVIGFSLTGHPEIPWVTSNHKIFTERGWVEAGDITKQDVLLFPIPIDDKTSQDSLLSKWPSLPFEATAPKVFKHTFVGNEKRVPYNELKELVDKGWTSEKMSKHFGFKTRQMLDLYIAKYGLIKNNVKVASSDILLEPMFWRIVGYWLAEGSLGRGRRKGYYTVSFSFGNKDAELISDTLDFLNKYKLRPTAKDTGFNTTHLFCASYQLAIFLEQFGAGAKNKFLPEWVMQLPFLYLEELVKGYWMGDGSLITNNVRITSISLQLLTGIQRILLRMGVVSSIYGGYKIGESSTIRNGPSTGTVIQNKHITYEIRFLRKNVKWMIDSIPVKLNRKTINKIKGEWLHVRIRDIYKKDYEGLVYDITTPSHDFLVGLSMLHNSDPTGHWLDKKDQNVRHICLPGEIRNFKQYVNPPEMAKFYTDDLLDTKRISWRTLKDLESKLGQYGYAGQIGQNPTPPGGGMFKVDKLIITDKFPYPNEIEHTIRYWDKAGTTDGGAYTVGLKMSRLVGNRWYIWDMVRGQWASQERERVIRSTAELDGTSVEIWMEQEPGSSGKESAEGTIRNLAGFRVFAEHPTGDKAYRADPFSVQVNNGSVIVYDGPWRNKLVEELRYFPFSAYKDITDSCSGAFNKLVAKKLARRVT